MFYVQRKMKQLFVCVTKNLSLLFSKLARCLRVRFQTSRKEENSILRFWFWGLSYREKSTTICYFFSVFDYLIIIRFLFFCFFRAKVNRPFGHFCKFYLLFVLYVHFHYNSKYVIYKLSTIVFKMYRNLMKKFELGHITEFHEQFVGPLFKEQNTLFRVDFKSRSNSYRWTFNLKNKIHNL